MRLAHITFTVARDSVATALEVLVAEVATVRRMKGNKAFIPFVDPTVDGGLGVLHEWDAAEDFAGYLSSPGFAAVNGILRPLMTQPPISRRFDADLISVN